MPTYDVKVFMVNCVKFPHIQVIIKITIIEFYDINLAFILKLKKCNCKIPRNFKY